MITTLRWVCPVLTALFLALNLSGCASTNPAYPPEEPAMHSVREIDDEYIAHVNDPWEGFNRSMYKFNYTFDKYVFLPVVNTYEFLAPTFVQTGVSNFFNNIGEICTLYNSLFQLKGGKALTTTGRFLTNSTLGIAGLFDPATRLGLARQNEDFGQTLGRWGVGTGPYVVMPVLGPATVRDVSGYAVDTGVHAALVNEADLDEDLQNGITALNTIDIRHQQPFRYYESGYPFEYYMVRFLYREKQELEALR
ncbi:MAG: VacJ family lipoprotein [Desulfobulbaceae bacterium]|jgi:phospholipid-binding lipoprotein MlaA|nr:VacJ family lipoprotein [Desulfobulbaceae bacterium]